MTTDLHSAAKAGDVDRVRECLDNGADVNAKKDRVRGFDRRIWVVLALVRVTENLQWLCC